jgi:hypothetical protein
MNSEDLAKVKQGLERLLSDVRNLTKSDEISCCSNKEDQMICRSSSCKRKHALMYLGLTALMAGIAGAFIAKKYKT